MIADICTSVLNTWQGNTWWKTQFWKKNIENHGTSQSVLRTSYEHHVSVKRTQQFLIFYHIWAAAWPNKPNDLCAQQNLRSAWASAESDQTLRWALNG